MRRFFKIFLGYLLTICLILNNLPLVTNADELVLADNAEITENETTDDISSQTDVASEEPYVIGELVEKREVNIKHFRMSDGSITAAVYPQVIHYKDETGAFVDIDNSFVDAQDDTDDVFANNKNEFQVKFMKKSNKNKLYTLNKGKEKITVSIEGVSKVKAKQQEQQAVEASLDNNFKLSNISSSVIYNDIFEDVDIEYTIASKELKENIILKKAVDFDSIVYNYKIGNQLKIEADDDKNIVILDKESNELVMHISAPLMWDSEGNYYDNLKLEIIEEKNTSAQIRLSWDIKENMVYPVTIDPVLSFSTNKYEIQDTYIVKSSAATNYNYNDHIKLRNDGYALLAFPTPDLSSGDKIVHAELILTPYMFLEGATNDYSNANSYSPSLYITSHKILKSWDETTVTYQSANADSGFYDSVVYSYRILNGDDDFYRWDITRLANEWTEGGVANNGVLLKFDKVPSDGSIANAFFCSTNGKYNPVAYYPQILYQYINTTGIEDYFSYHTQNLGYAGTGYTNDLTGNLTIINPVVQTGGSLMPINVSLVYNSNNVCENQRTLYGNGWNINWSQKIDRTIEEDFGYNIAKYIDGDGTQHYFNYDETTGLFIDEIDPKRTIVWIDSYNYMMKDSSGTRLFFKRFGTVPEWYLTQVTDRYGNYIQIELDTANYNKVKKLTSSTGNIVEFLYDTNGILNQIKYYDNETEKSVTLGYINHITENNNCLRTITYADNTTVEYSYHNTASYLSKAMDIDGTSIEYGYAWHDVIRVNNITRYSTEQVQGQRVSIAYQTAATTFTDLTNSRKYLYTFAANGTLKSVVDVTENDGNGYGQYYEYNNGNTSDTKGKDNLTFISKTQKSTVNMLRDHSFEKEFGLWAYQAWKQNNGTSNAVLSSSIAYLGTKSYQLYRSADCDATRVLAYDRIDITLGQQYTMSAYVNTKDMISQGKGASVYVVGEYFEFESEYITETKNEWQRISVTFVAPITGKASICLSMVECSGYAYFDCVQIEKGELSEYNLLENAGFEGPYGTTAESWGSYTGENFLASNEHVAGNYSLRFDGEPDKDNEYQQVIYINGNAGDTYVASAFGKADSVPASGWQFTLLVHFMRWGTYVNTVTIPFNSYTTEWQKVSGIAKAEGYYTAIVFHLLYCENANDVYFDNAQFIKDNFGSTYTYDENGNIISTVDLQGKEEYTFQYDGNNQLIKETNLSGGVIDYTYNSNIKQQLDAVSSGGVTTEYTYDNQGNVLTSTARASDSNNGLVISSSATYSDNGEYMESLTDSRGNVTQYAYNETRGYLDYTTAPDGSVTDYTYNASELLTNVSESKDDDMSTVTYNYDAVKRLSVITSPSGTTYNFTYDNFSRNNDIKIGDTKNLSNYIYNNKGLLEQLIYGNGTTVEYEYDNLNRETETSINDILRYQYTYDGSSRLLEVLDVLNSKKTKYDYDILDRIAMERIFDTENKTELAKLRIRYDNTKNRISGYDVSIKDTEKSTDYIYGELEKAPDIITGVKQNDTRILSYGYDILNRLQTRTIATTTPFVTEYGYLEGSSANTTTTLVKTVKNGSDTFEYAYDNMGNIVSVSKNGELVESYTYDYLGQLKTVTRGTDTYEYTYDNGGNILSVKQNGEITKTYTYGDSEWKDLLTAYNGETITYDAIGNPLTYRAGMNFAWTDGRKLSNITQGTDSISYTYDANGLRSSKTVNETTTEYYWLNGTLHGQKTGNEYLLFLYDENGNAYGFILQNGTEKSYYYYEFNLQGDIIGIIDSTGTKVVEYTYNEWGEILNVTGTLAETIGQKNPLRYRGYYYDAETGFYYVSSRYYDPEIGRFISADTTDVLDVQRDLYDKNLYSYCDNNPVMRVDYSGKVWITVGIMAVGGVIGVVIGAVSSAITQNALTGTVNWKSVVVAGAAGFVSGAVAASPLGLTGQVVAGSMIGSLSYVADCKVNKKAVAVDELAVAALGGTASGFIGGPGANQNMALTNTIQTSIKTTTRMSTRACTTYAAKQIASTKAWRNNILTVNAMGSSARFAAGTGVSNAIASAFTTVKGWFSKLFK